jgi:gamma-glutamylcyclotransferase (GGCT)/AIG2-like uncharacterized protein YtfP
MMADEMKETLHCFAYGTLMCEDIMRKVAGGRFARTEATLQDYERLAVKEQVYPAIVERPGAVVRGVLYFDLPETSWMRLDGFEGEVYSRVVVSARCMDGRTVDAGTYVMRPEFRHLLAEAEWDVEEFLRSGKTEFENTYSGFGKLGNTRGATG